MTKATTQSLQRTGSRVSSQELASIKQQLKNLRAVKAPKRRPNRSDTVLNTYYVR